jgi:hypothetical protein
MWHVGPKQGHWTGRHLPPVKPLRSGPRRFVAVHLWQYNTVEGLQLLQQQHCDSQAVAECGRVLGHMSVFVALIER